MKCRADATSSINASMSELRNSNDWLQLLQMRWKCRGMPVRVLEAQASFAEVHLSRDTCVLHPLQGAVHRGTADPLVFFADEIDEIVGAQVSLLAEEHADDEVALAGAFAAGRAHAIEVESLHARRNYSTLVA